MDRVDAPLEAAQLSEELEKLLLPHSSVEDGARAVRIFKKQQLLIITLKDILKKAEFQEIVSDLSNLADVILSGSLRFLETFLSRRYGMPAGNAVAVMGLGKLGAQELNYSSDVDIIFVYKNDEGETSGISTAPGVTRNRISAFEYYTKLVEEYNRFLSANTADGFAYRVDLRLRPQGQRGGLALSIKSYEEYYESWGQLWERAALLRIRTVAGDAGLGNEFIEMIKPFVYRKYLDFQSIDEIRRMKAQVEQIKSGTLSKDIKRGYGGIREIEFFIQIFQLIYGGREPMLKERSTLKTLHRLLQKELIGHDDFHHLSENYIFFRTLEHRLQQLNDIQTHALPAGDRELDVLGRKMGLDGKAAFLADLDRRRRKVRSIYDSLLEVRNREAEDPGPSSEGVLSNIFWDMETPIEHLLEEELSKTRIKDVSKAIRYLVKIRNTLHSFQTIKGRRLLENIIPLFIDEALKGPDPELALLNLVDFSALMSTKESYLEIISQKHKIVSVLNFAFSNSEYLSKILMSNPEYLESLAEGGMRKKSLRELGAELKLLIDTHGESKAIRLFRRLEEIRLGILFLDRKIDVRELTNALGKVAETVVLSLVGQSPNLFIAGFGKLGGREITFNSDLDLVFITPDEPTAEDIRAAERLLKLSMSYTKDGLAYKMDTRLRPEGNKGPLVSSVKGLTGYYSRHAQSWELQALLKARPISHDIKSCRRFMEMREKILMKRGRELTITELKKMRERIYKELSKESLSAGVYDIKLGSGGLEELEFSVQYLQLQNCHASPRLLVQGTLDAIKRLNSEDVLKEEHAVMLREAYKFYRNIETILRLRSEPLFRGDGKALTGMISIMDTGPEKFLNALNERKRQISGFWEAL